MDVLMPQLGETVAEGKIVKWFKSTGETVDLGDNLFEIETDKTSMEVPSTIAGTLTDIRVQVGEVVTVGTVVAVIADSGEALPAAKSGTGPGAGTSTDAPTIDSAIADPFREVRTPDRNFGPARLASGVYVTPLARRLAAARGIDLSRVSGSGPRGRIVARDIEQSAPAAMTESVVTSRPGRENIEALYKDVAYEEVPLDSMRATIARRLVEAKQTIPHFYLTVDMEADRLIAMREEINAAAPKEVDGRPSFKLSLNDFMIKAWATALRQIPAGNAVWADDRILRFVQSDISVAVSIDGGLITPVLRNAQSKSLATISAEMRDLIARARARKLTPDEYQGGASAISNLGMYGVREFSAIINPPHGSILAIGASRRAPVEIAGGGIKFVNLITVTLSCDHRVVDGACAAELLAAFKGLVENPLMLIAM